MENTPSPTLKCLSCNKKMRPIKKDYLFIKNGINKRTRCKKCYKEYIYGI